MLSASLDGRLKFGGDPLLLFTAEMMKADVLASIGGILPTMLKREDSYP